MERAPLFSIISDMSKIQLFFHHIFRFIWNSIFILSYPILASFGLLFIGLTFLFSKLSQVLTLLRPEGKAPTHLESAWEDLPNANGLLEAKLEKQILFGPTGVKLRRKDGVPSVLSEHVFGKKVRPIEEGLLLEKWNSLESNELPDFDICLYDPEMDQLRVLTQIRCFDWHLAEIKEKQLLFKWFDGTQGGEQWVAL